jgi:hypothetical protein
MIIFYYSMVRRLCGQVLQALGGGGGGGMKATRVPVYCPNLVLSKKEGVRRK